MVNPAPEKSAAPPAVPGLWLRWRGPILFVSLGLNLFLVGIMAGGWWHHYQGRHHFMQWARHGMMGEPLGPMGGQQMGGPMGPPVMAAVREAVSRLPEADRKPFEDAMAAQRGQILDMQQEIRRARLKVNDAIRAEPFDAKAMEAALADVRAKVQAIQVRIHTTFIEAVSKLPTDKRRDLAESIANIRMRR